MDSSDQLLTAMRQLARQMADQPTDRPIPPAEVARLVKAAAPGELPGTIAAAVQEAQSAVDRTPRAGWALARVADALAHATDHAPAQAGAELGLAIVLNRVWEFHGARAHAQAAAALFERHGSADQAARSLCEWAWADAFVGDPQHALAQVERARTLTDSSLVCARGDWIQARVLRDQAKYQQAESLLIAAQRAFQVAQMPLEAARCEFELAHSYMLSRHAEALPLLHRLHQTFAAAGNVLDVALCDVLIGSSLIQAERFSEAHERLVVTRNTAARLGFHFLTAWYDQNLGIVFRHLNRYEESLRASRRSRDCYAALGIQSQVCACDINLGNVYYTLNRYDEALAAFQEAASLSIAEGREARTALLYNNMGLVYAKQGRFSQALDLYHRALHLAKSKDLWNLTAAGEFGLAACYRELGQYTDALACMRSLKDMAVQQHHREGLVQCDLVLADIQLTLGETAEAVNCLDAARRIALADGLDSWVAASDRLLARAAAQTAGREQSLARIQNARALFMKHAQTVDAALCDLTEGELDLTWQEPAAAQACLHRARAILSPAFPDQAWRADYALGHCAALAGNDAAALEHYLSAVRTIAGARAALVTEQLSGDFFARRQSVYDEALALALRQGAAECALEIVEASKARTLLTLLARRGWRVAGKQPDAYLADLTAREKELRYQLNALRARIAVQVQDLGESLRSGREFAMSAAALEELNARSQAYESVVAQLRLATTGLAGIAALARFSLGDFRAAACERLGTDWAALEYYLTEESLIRIAVYPDRLETASQELTAYDRAVLEQCTRTDADVRELVYGGTLRGHAVASVGTKYLRHLYRLLIPADLSATTLVVVPHGVLHRLPFHALIDGPAYLIEKHTVFCAPGLQALQHLLGPSVHGGPVHPLIVGVSQFGARARPLPHALEEVARLRQTFEGRGRFLREQEATRQSLLDLNASGGLDKFALVHFATHAVLDPRAPHQSRVLLHDDALTALDILDLSLSARLVVLSACQSALGEGGHGDEWLGLARAFFYAGAHALLATLWPVQDETMVELTERFYRHWTGGKDAAESLRQTEVEMIHAGCSPSQWGAFVLLGRP